MAINRHVADSSDPPELEVENEESKADCRHIAHTINKLKNCEFDMDSVAKDELDIADRIGRRGFVFDARELQ